MREMAACYILYKAVVLFLCSFPLVCADVVLYDAIISKARSRKAGGSGIGLALCDRIARLHGAELRIESRVGEGTKVTVTWNREQEGKTDE